ncbi:hypothetical protein [Mycolicibacterium sp. XJ870]
MSIRDWSSAKVRLVMLAIAAPFMTIWVIVGYAQESSGQNPDCAHADTAARHWAVVIPGIHAGLAGGAETPNLSRDTADAADAIRGEADSITDSTLKTKVLALATALDRVSRGNPSSPPNGFPDKDYMGGMQGATSALHDLKIACPDIGD